MAVQFGDRRGALFAAQQGGDQVLVGRDDDPDARDILAGDAGAIVDRARGGADQVTLVGRGGDAYGDASGRIAGDGQGGDDTLAGAATEGANSTLVGDAELLRDRARGGADLLEGGAGGFNLLAGDGFTLAGQARGGADTLLGAGGGGEQILYGDARTLTDRARGGDDLLVGGTGALRNVLYGDGSAIEGRARAGNDTLVGAAGTTDIMAGDAEPRLTDARARLGADVFVVAPDGGEDWILDFQAGLDRVDLTAFGGLGFADLAPVLGVFEQELLGTIAGTRITFADGATLTLVGVGIDAPALTEADLVF